MIRTPTCGRLRAAIKGGTMGRRLFWAMIGFLGGGLLTLVGGLVAADVFAISQMEGAYAMGLVFFWVPLGAVAGAILGMVAARRGP
jgi:hypothetical protein